MLAFKNANLIDGSGRPPVGGAAILIDGDKFAAVGPSAEIPSDAVIIDLRGKTVIPGLSDAHIHIGGSSGLDRPGMSGRKESYDFVEMRENCLRWGVLTVRTCGQFMDEALAFRDEVKAGTAAASPRVLVSSAMYQAPQGHPCYTVFGSEPKIEQNACVIVTDDLDIEASVQASAEAGVDFIKTFYAHLNKMNYPHPVPRLSCEALRRIVDAAHSNGLKVAAHVDSPPELADALKCGVDFIEHLIGVGETETELTAALVEQARAAGTIIVPTMISILRFDPLGSAKPVWEPLKKAVKQLYDGGVRLAVGC
ncbi:MAG: amidohydrolase family protein, partial [Synergistaceae bacterium]|nr:amidohydrolase family protein [Synergistaceae bacterium]